MHSIELSFINEWLDLVNPLGHVCLQIVLSNEKEYWSKMHHGCLVDLLEAVEKGRIALQLLEF